MNNNTIILKRAISPERNTVGVRIVLLKKLSWFKRFKKYEEAKLDKIDELPNETQLSIYQEMAKNNRNLLLGRFK